MSLAARLTRTILAVLDPTLLFLCQAWCPSAWRKGGGQICRGMVPLGTRSIPKGCERMSALLSLS